VTAAFGIPLAAGLVSALMYLSLAKGFAIGMLLSYLAPLPVLMAGFAGGAFAAGLGSIAAVVAIAGVAGGMASLPFALAVAAPSVLVVRQALLWRVAGPDDTVEWYPPGRVLALLTGMAATLILAGGAVVASQQPGSDPGLGLEGWVTETVAFALRSLAPMLDEAQRGAVLGWWVPFFPAMVAGSWLAMMVANTILALGIAARLGRSRRPVPAYRELSLPTWLGGVLAVSLGVGVIVESDLGYLSRSVAVIALVPFALLGLAAVHGWASGRPHAGMILFAVYGVLFLGSAWVLLPVTVLGLVRFVMRFRSPGAGPGGGKEE